MTVNLDRSVFAVGDDPLVDITVTRDGQPFDLTDCTVEIVAVNKNTSDTADDDYTLSSTGTNPAITITDMPGGVAVADFLGKMETVTIWLYRARVIDTADDNRQYTFDRGSFHVT